jgi:hypothetical protein
VGEAVEWQGLAQVRRAGLSNSGTHVVITREVELKALFSRFGEVSLNGLCRGLHNNYCFVASSKQGI